VSIQRWHHGNRPQQTRSHGPQFTKDPISKVAILCNHRGGSMKSTPHRHHRDCPYAHVCQGNFPNDASHDRRSKRVRACSGYGETIHDRRSSKARVCMDKDLKIEFQYTHRARARAYLPSLSLWVPFETSEIRQQDCGPLKCQRKVVRHDDAHCSRNHANQATFTLRNAKSRWFAHVAHHRHFAYLDDHG